MKFVIGLGKIQSATCFIHRSVDNRVELFGALLNFLHSILNREYPPIIGWTEN